MSTNTASALVLADMVSSYNEVPAHKIGLVRVTRAPRATTPASKPTSVRKLREEKTPSNNAPKAPIMVTGAPSPGTFTAEEFILACRGAGKVFKLNDNGVKIPLVDSNKEKKDQMIAIAGFVGYDLRQPHGMQLDMARRKAQFMLRPGVDSKVAATAAGFVAGMPNESGKKITDLQSRIRVATDLMVTHEVAADKATDETERAVSFARATVECERIAHMRKDLAALTG